MTDTLPSSASEASGLPASAPSNPPEGAASAGEPLSSVLELDNRPTLSELLGAPDPDELATGPEMFRTMGILERLRAAQSASLEAFRQEVLASDSGWSAGTVPRVRKTLQLESGVTLDDELLLRCGETRAFWSGIESRFAECSRCEAPEVPPTCLDSGMSPGVVMRLKIIGAELPHPSLERKLTPCARFQDYRLSRRLHQAGVPQRLTSQRLQKIDNPECLTNATRAFEKVVAQVRAHAEMTLLIQGRLSREYGAALLAECVAAQAGSVRSLHVPTFVRSERVAMVTRSNESFLPYVGADVLLLDGIEPAQLETKYWLDEILWLQEARRDKGLITLITTNILKTTLKDTFPGSLALVVEKKK